MGYEANIGEGYLKFKNFSNLVNSNPQIRDVRLDNFGEMFLNPELAPIIEYAYKKNIKISCDTGVNLNYVTDEILESLVKHRFSSLTCSMDGASDSTYKIYRVGGDFKEVVNNIRKINRYKKKYNSKFPNLKWQFIVFGHNEHEIPIAKEMAKSLNMEFYTKMSWDKAYSPIKDKNFVMAQTGWPCVTRAEHEQLIGKNCMRGVCYILWHSPRVSWDGKVSGCCWNTWSEFGGNVFLDGYINSINGEKINYAKQMLLGKAEPHEDIPCSTCEIYLKLRKTKDYLTLSEIFRYQSVSHKIFALLYRKLGLKRFKNLIIKNKKGLCLNQ